MRTITLNQACTEAIAEEMERDPSVFIMGEDIGENWGGAIGEYKGLAERVGAERVLCTPVSEIAIVGAAIGAAELGMRPICHLMFSEFICVCMAEVANFLCRSRYMTGGMLKMPVTIVTTCGAGLGAAGEHSSSMEGLFTSITGLKVVLPSTPYDAKGLLKSAIRDDNPTVYLHHKLLVFSGVKSEVPEDEYIVPLGKADIKRKGTDVTVVATAAMVHEAMAAAEKLQKRGISLEVVDLRTLEPLDLETIIESLEKTGRIIIFTEEPKKNSAGLRIAGLVAENAFDLLDAPIKVIGAPDTPVPFSPALEKVWIPNQDKLFKVIDELV